MQIEPAYVLVVQMPGGCHTCREAYENNHRVTIESIEQHEGIGWKLRGKGRVSTHCVRCYAMYDAVQISIPIECKSYPCPDCGELQSLKYKVQKIDANGNEFSFEAEISCTKCHKKKTFIEVLKELLKLKKLEVKLTGISVER
jgi:5-methylcytosine-specific restriction endonuclease McrA